MAKTTKVTKRVVRKRKERKNVERGAAHIASSFNNTIVTITDTARQRPVLGERRRTRFPRQQEVHALCGADGCRNCGQGGHGAWPEDR